MQLLRCVLYHLATYFSPYLDYKRVSVKKKTFENEGKIVDKIQTFEMYAFTFIFKRF